MRSEVYEEMQQELHARALACERMYPIAGPAQAGPVPKTLDDEESVRLETRVATFGSSAVLAALESALKALSVVHSHAWTMKASEARGVSVTVDGIEKARIAMRARMKELDEAVRSDLESL